MGKSVFQRREVNRHCNADGGLDLDLDRTDRTLPLPPGLKGDAA